MMRIEKLVGVPLGSGYPSDPVTRKYVKGYHDQHQSLPTFVRASWKTVENILNGVLMKNELPPSL